MPIVVDGQTYQYRGLVCASTGSGEGAEHLNFTVYTDPGGRLCWLGEENKKWYLYRDPTAPESLLKVIQTHEEFSARTFSVFGKETTPVHFSWGALENRQLGETGPFRGADQVMMVGSEMKLEIPLVKESNGDVYFGPAYRAKDVPRHSVTPGSTAATKAALVLLLGLAGAMALAVGFKVSWPIRLFWWLGPILALLRLSVSRHGFLGMTSGVLSGVFFLHFATHGLDYLVTRDWEEAAVPLFESARLGATCILLLGLRAIWPQLYLALVDGAFRGAGLAWALYFGGQVVVASVLEDKGYLSWFSYYASIPQWSWIWPLFLASGVWRHFKDYRRVPVNRQGFRELLYRTQEITGQGLQASLGAAKRLEGWADDLEDALMLSAAPAVRAFTFLAPSFLRWREQAQALESISEESLDDDLRESLESDLRVISEDFNELLDALDKWPNSSQQLKTLRYSPLLVAWNR